MYTVVYALYRKEGLSREDFTRHWVEVHAPLGAKIPGIVSYRIFPVAGSVDALQDADGFAVVDYGSEAGFQIAGASPEMAAAVEDTANFARHFGVYNVEAHTVI